MNFDQYKEKLNELNEEFKEKKFKLLKLFVDSNNTLEIGDIVTDHNGSIKIHKIKYDIGNFGCSPCAVYEGLELKKDLTPKKIPSIRKVWQSNLK